MNPQIRKAAQAVAGVVTMPEVVQSQGTWRPGARCCVGARLAHALNVESGDYRDGRRAFARSMECNDAQLVLMLRQAGAGHSPFSGFEWPNSPKEVWANLMEIKEFPNTQGANLSGVGLTEASMQTANLRGANLKGTRLRESDLRSADLRGACARSASLMGADLRGADLRGADLSKADLRGADLRGADLRGANLRWANLKHADLAGAQLEGTILKHARLGHTELDPHPDGSRILTFLRAAAQAVVRATSRSSATPPTGAGKEQKPETVRPKPRVPDFLTWRAVGPAENRPQPHGDGELTTGRKKG